MADVRLITATLTDYEKLFNLAQFYQYDFTEFLPGELDNSGHYPYIDVRRYLTQKDQHAYLAYADRHLAGFVLVRDRPEQRKRPGRYLAEFFVMRPFRRKGVGKEMAFQTFDTHRGYWEIAEVGSNTPAHTFWCRVIGDYTRNRFEEFTTDDPEDGMTIFWQAFDSSQW
jgi:predicted acetyltransferase